MVDLILFVFITYGLTNILLYGKILDKVRPDWYLFKCSMCMGFWVAACVSIFFNSGWTPDYRFIHILFFAGLGSGTTYILDKLFGDDGLKIEHKVG